MATDSTDLDQENIAEEAELNVSETPKAKKAISTAKATSAKKAAAKKSQDMAKDPRKLKAIQAAMEHIERQFGKGAIMRLGQNELTEIEAISTGSLSLDLALGVGGLPMGRIIEIYGPESSGKTTLTLELIAQAQKVGKVCAFIDAEHALDPIYAKRLGVQVDDMLISQPDTGEQALDITETLVRSGAIDVIVVDSVAALVPKAEIEGDMGDNHVGLQARLMSQALRKLTGTIKQANCMVVFINQLRMKIGVMFGNPETTTGGNALKYYSSVRLDIRKGAAIKDKNDVIVGNETRVKVVKNKVAPPFKQANFQILFNYGISKTMEIVEMATQLGFLTKAGGGWICTADGEKIVRGKFNVQHYFDQHPELTEDLEAKIIDYYKNHSDYEDSVDIGGGDDADDDLGDDMEADLVSDIPDDL